MTDGDDGTPTTITTIIIPITPRMRTDIGIITLLMHTATDNITMVGTIITGLINDIGARRCWGSVIAHPPSARGCRGRLAANTNWRTASTDARLAFAVPTTERNAA